MNPFNDNDTQRWPKHLGWSAKQGRILTAEGLAAAYYTADRGFDFAETELPHYHLRQSRTSDGSDTRAIFRQWRQQQGNTWNKAPVVGAWRRTLFYGAWECTTDADEDVYNLQTPSLFIDLRLPRTRLRSVDRVNVTCLDDLTGDDLRKFARQHVFGGYTVMQKVDATSDQSSNDKGNAHYPLVCTRHHIMDWNFTGTPRNRPNKWYVEVDDRQDPPARWKEWAYAKNDHGQHYYCEWWESLLTAKDPDGGSSIPCLALRQCPTDDPKAAADGLLIVVGSHFNYLFDHRTRSVADAMQPKGSLVETVDALLEDKDETMARAWLELRGGHGRITATAGWKIDAATEFWKEGTLLFESRSDVQVVVSDDDPQDLDSLACWHDHAWVRWKGLRWEIVECSFPSAQELQSYICRGLPELAP